MVDARAMGRWRRDRGLAGAPASLSSSAAPRQPALYQLLAWRLCDPRDRRHPPPDLHQRPRLEPALPMPDPHGAADPARIDGPQDSLVTDEEVSDRLTP